jgi:hypothetical protein
MSTERTILITKLVGFREGITNALDFSEINIPGAMGYVKLLEARMAIGRACLHLGSPDPYKSNRDLNMVIEDGVDLGELAAISNPGDVLSLKSMIRTCDLYLREIVEIRMRPLHSISPAYGYLLVRSLDRAVDSLEEAICYYSRDLREWKKVNADAYEEILRENNSEATVPEDAVRTDEIMKNRSKE